MERFGERFDHNLHALRIVESFEQRYARFPGLNLTFEVREGIVKHSRDFAPGEEPELDDYLPGLRPPLEAQLIDLADEIAYNTADLDDAFSAGMLTAEDVAACVPQYRAISRSDRDAVSRRHRRASASTRALRQLMDALVSGLIEGTVAAARAPRASPMSTRSVRCAARGWRRSPPEAAETSRALKQLPAPEGVRFSRRWARTGSRSMAMIGELFRFFVALPGPAAGALREQAGRRSRRTAWSATTSPA